ncbi:MAG: HprK-related kinase A [Gammaproteobacteria bacterium]
MKEKSFNIRIEPFVVRLTTSISSVIESITNLYSDYEFLPESPGLFIDFRITIDRPPLLHGYLRSQVQCYVDGKSPFKPLPLTQAYPFFEWGLNWVIASHVYNYLLIHAGVLERNGFAILLSGVPGAGKSTLCAALMNRGWRLFSDEMAIVDLSTNELIPFVRPISLKNQSIDLMKRFAPNSIIGKSFFDTTKGTVAHMKPTADSVARANSKAVGRWMVFPTYQSDAATSITEISKGQAVISLIKNSFNSNVLAGKGFNSLCKMVDSSRCYNLEYANLDEAIDFFDELSGLNK